MDGRSKKDRVPRKRTGGAATALLAAALIGAGCDKDPADALLGGGGDGRIEFNLQDGCSDGRGLQVRFFDHDNGLVWPDSGQVFLVEPGQTLSVPLDCQQDALICYGAIKDPSDGSYWGVGIDGSRGCDDCCYRCNGQSVFRTLRC